MSEPLFIGIDGGGTGCRVAMRAGLSGPVLQGAGGPANIMTDTDTAITNISSAVAEALKQNNLSARSLEDAHVHLGLAGVVDTRFDHALSAAFPDSAVTVSDDRLTTLVGALGNDNGSVAGIGTGSFIGRRSGHDVRFVGGWGGIIGDQSSGAWLGKRAMEETLKAHDGLIEGTRLSRALLEEFEGPIGLVTFARTAHPGDFATVAPKVIDQRDDPLARALLREGAEYILLSLTALGAKPDERLVLSGGLGRFYRAMLPPKWQRSVFEPRGTALDGALHLSEEKL